MPYRHFLGRLETTPSLLLYQYVARSQRVYTSLSAFFCNSAITGSVIFKSECTRNRLSAELTSLPSTLKLDLGARTTGQGTGTTERKENGRRKRENGTEGMGKGQGSIPAYTFSYFQPCYELTYPVEVTFRVSAVDDCDVDRRQTVAQLLYGFGH